MRSMFVLVLLLAGCAVGNSEVDKIIKAKQEVLSRLNYPDTADFHDMKTQVRGSTVTLTVTAKNAFGTPSTHTFNIRVE